MTSGTTVGTAPTWVLLEGASDVAAIRALRAARGVEPEVEPCRLVDMGGATNIRRHLELAATSHPRPRVIGLCDEREAPFFVRAVGAVPHRREPFGEPLSVDTLAERGFQICRRDLEDELLRALGVDGALGVLTDVGLRAAFTAFAHQPAWQGRPELEQLHRFCGTTSGRKELLAAALARALDGSSCPPPLAALLASMPLP